MRVGGSHAFAAPRARVFAAIRDPRVLLAVIPGCREVEETAPDEYEGSLVLRLPGAVGTYRTHVRLVDVEAPSSAGLEGGVDGAMGSIVGRVDFTLTENGDASRDLGRADDRLERAAATRLDYAGSARIDGPLARLDGAIAERLAMSLIDQGLRALDARLALPDPPLATTEVAE